MVGTINRKVIRGGEIVDRWQMVPSRAEVGGLGSADPEVIKGTLRQMGLSAASTCDDKGVLLSPGLLHSLAQRMFDENLPPSVLGNNGTVPYPHAAFDEGLSEARAMHDKV